MIDSLEFAERLLKILNEDSVKKVLKSAAASGFKINGFSKNITIAPLNMVIKALRGKTKNGIFFSNIIIKAISLLDDVSYEEKADNLSVSEIAKSWLDENEQKKLYAIEALEKLEKIENVDEINKGVIVSHNSDFISTEKSFDEINILKNENQRLHEKNKRLETKIQGYKIQIDDNTKTINLLKSDIEKLSKKCLEFESQNMGLKKFNEELQEISITNEKIMKELNENNNYLRQYEPKASNVLCFSKNKFDIEKFLYKNITVINEWKEELSNEISWDNYNEVWIITKDFPYGDICQIASFCKCKVHKFFSINKIRIDGGVF